ncbi:MAG TPA: hypothetical protein VE860_23040 [Chthoniobacterales bacterium]|nr:hypothetical protein [Chthoniobacterales bacterium]
MSFSFVFTLQVSTVVIGVSQQILTTLTRISQKAFSMRDKFSD